MVVERGLVEHCAPTLAAMKTGSLFNAVHGGAEEIEQQVAELNRQLGPRGVQVEIVRRGQLGSLIYVFRPSQLEQALACPAVCAFLAQFGYGDTGEVAPAVCRLCQRLRGSEDFPHEIGIFLGYPLEDVEAFIRHGGRNCKCTGCWKVYHNEEEALRRFGQFKKCAQVYRRCWERGRSVEELTVAS